MESLDPECTALKQAYDKCFHIWYSEKFLKGVLTNDCEELFKVYQSCVKVREWNDTRRYRNRQHYKDP